jgi:hypothetical protein
MRANCSLISPPVAMWLRTCVQMIEWSYLATYTKHWKLVKTVQTLEVATLGTMHLVFEHEEHRTSWLGWTWLVLCYKMEIKACKFVTPNADSSCSRTQVLQVHTNRKESRPSRCITVMTPSQGQGVYTDWFRRRRRTFRFNIQVNSKSRSAADPINWILGPPFQQKFAIMTL